MTFRQRYWLRSVWRTHAQAKSVLAMLCLALSLAMLMLVLSLQSGMRAQTALILEDTGNRNLTIAAGTVRALPNRGSGVVQATNLTQQDYAALLLQAQRRSERAAAIANGTLRVKFRELAMAANVMGADPTYFGLQHFQLAQGRLFDALDNRNMMNVAVIGAQVAEQLFSMSQERVLASEAITGQRIIVSGVPFEIIGVLAARGSGLTGMSQDDVVYIPLATAMNQVFDESYLSRIIIEADNLDEIPQLRDQLTRLLRERHAVPEGAEDDFTVLDATSAIAATSRNQIYVTMFFRWLAILMLTMAGVGLFAVNHLGVKSREHEFGLHRAVGATRVGIVTMVLAETLLLGAGGGLAGVVFGAVAFSALAIWTSWALQVDAWVIAQVAVAALMMSVGASLLPAFQTAWRNPVQALNQE